MVIYQPNTLIKLIRFPMRRKKEGKEKIWDDCNPIKQVVFDKKDGCSKNDSQFGEIYYGPKLETNFLFQLNQLQNFDSYRSESELLALPDTTPRKTNEIVSNQLPEGSNISGKQLKIENSNIDQSIAQKRKTSISRISQRFGKFSKKRMSDGKVLRSLPKGITLQEIFFRQKIERFVRNILSQCAMNDLGRLDVKQLRIINDKSSSENVISKLNSEKSMQKKKDDQLNKKVRKNLNFK